jgi:two-component system cell cycle response regulator
VTAAAVETRWRGVAPETRTAGARIVVVDDDDGVRQSVAWVLEEHGYDVVAFSGGDALIERLDGDDGPPDLLLLDILMPDADGVQLLERVKSDERWRDVPVLMLSSVPPEEATVRTLGLGAADFIRKPFRGRELVARVQAQLRAGAMLRATRDALHRAEAELRRARDDAENRRRLVDILHEVTSDIATHEVYHVLVRRVARALAVSYCSVILARPGDARGTVASAFEFPKLPPSQHVDLDDFPEVRRALADGAPVLIEDVATDALYDGGRVPLGLDGAEVPVRSAIALPFAIEGEGERNGVFLLRRTREQPPLGPEDVAFADAVIGAAVAAVQRARVIETTRADNERLAHLATTDPLTALLNRRALTERLTREMERALRDDSSVALLLIDLDHFKRVNDTHGHLVGDAVLRDVAELLLAGARGSDFVGRFGGEEFLIVLPDTDDDGAATFAERIRERVEAHRFRGREADATLHMTTSIGVATFPAALIESVEDLFARADAALYRAKADGRNRVRA